MKAAVLISDGSLQIQERGIPTPAKNEYLIRIHSVGVCNSDIFRGFQQGAYQYPLVMGHEISGIVEQAGPETDRLKSGDAVVVFPLIPCGKCEFCKNEQWVHCLNYDYYGSRRDGGYQEYLVVKDWNLLRIPDGVSIDLACLCEPTAVCLRATSMLPDNAKNIAVIGSGLLGLISAMILSNRKIGPTVTIFDRNEFKLKIAKGFKLQGQLINESNDSNELSFDAVLEASGAIPTYHLSLDLIASGGTVVWMGNIQDEITFSKKQISSILRRELTIKGVWNSEYHNGNRDDWMAALELIRNSDWIPQIISHNITLDELPDILKRMHSIKTNHTPHDIIKAIVRMQ